jgi:hypothetical protein
MPFIQTILERDHFRPERVRIHAWAEVERGKAWDSETRPPDFLNDFRRIIFK